MCRLMWALPKNHLKLLIRNAARAGKLVLSEDDSKKFLNTYRINVTLPHFAADANAAASAASGHGLSGSDENTIS